MPWLVRSQTQFKHDTRTSGCANWRRFLFYYESTARRKKGTYTSEACSFLPRSNVDLREDGKRLHRFRLLHRSWTSSRRRNGRAPHRRPVDLPSFRFFGQSLRAYTYVVMFYGQRASTSRSPIPRTQSCLMGHLRLCFIRRLNPRQDFTRGSYIEPCCEPLACKCHLNYN